MAVAVARRLSAGALRSHLFPTGGEGSLFDGSGVMLDSICAFGGDRACSSNCANRGYSGGYCNPNNDCVCT
jgi:hypothetical protein